MNNLKFYFNHFDATIDKMDLDNMDYDIPKIKLDGLNLKLKQGALVSEIAEKTKKVTDSLAKHSSLKLKLGEISVSKINIGYDNLGIGLNTGLVMNKMLIRMNSIDIQRQNLDVQSLEINGARGALAIGKYKIVRAATASDSTSADKQSWKVKLNQADLKQIAFKYDNENNAHVKQGIDYNHMDYVGLNLDGEKFVYSPEVVSGNIYAFTIKDKSGLNVQSLKTEFYYGPKSAYLKKLYLKTPQTLLKDQIIVGYPSIASLNKNTGELSINASLTGSRVSFKDVMIFAPQLSNTNPFKSNPDAVVNINGKLTGKLKDIKVENLQLSGIGNTQIDASGNIKGLPNAKAAHYDVAIRNFESTARDINSFLPKGTLPNTIQLPSQMSAQGTFNGTLNDFFTDLSLNSSFGSAKFKGNFDQTKKNAERYNGNAELNNFDIGKLTKNDKLGKISAKAKVAGVGFNPQTATASVDGTVAGFYYNRYTYRNSVIKANIKSGVYNANLVMKDPNLGFDLVSNGSFNDNYPAVKLKMNVDIADLEKLNLHAGPLKLKGQIDGDVPTSNPDYLNGTVDLHNIEITNERGQFLLDTINIVATATAQKNTLAVKSQFADANIDGKYKLTNLVDALTNSFAKYYDVHPTAKKPKSEPQQLAFKVSIKNNPMLVQLVPGLKSLEPILITGRYNTVNDSIVLNGNIPQLSYDGMNINGAVVKVDTKGGALVYGVVLNGVENPQFTLPKTNLSGTIQNNLIAYDLQIKDLKDKDRYKIAGNLKASDANTEMKLNEQLVLNYESWNMNPANRIQFGKNGFFADAVDLSKKGSSINIQSQAEHLTAPMDIKFKDFKIETITNILQKEDYAMSGNINGDATLKNIKTSPVFTADLNVTDFTFRKDTVGTLKIKVNNETANLYRANIGVTGQGNTVNVDGTYRPDNSSYILDMDMQKLNLKSVQGFTLGNLTNSSGFLSGQFKINGNTKGTKVLGTLKFNDVGFNVKQLNSHYKSMNDEIVFNDSGIAFDQFAVSDDQNNLLIVDGNIATQNLRDLKYNLTVRADNFMAMNSQEKDNDLYYGVLYLDTRLTIGGNFNEPKIGGSLKANKDTKLTILLPQQDPSIADREGIVEFIDQDHPELNKKITLNDSVNKMRFRGIDALVNIRIDKDAEMSIIIDKGNGDYLKLKGDANLTGGMDATGKTTLTGRYEFTEGTYEMTFNLIKRKFEIKEGSYISWTGQPSTADISVTAVYKTEASPLDLLNDQLGNVDAAVRNTYKQKIPFETNLIMKGELLKPEITFDIILHEGNNTVSTEIINGTQAKLAQLRQEPSELNKQVFALLLLNRFIGENPFASESGGATAESLARQSASKILSQQLNDLAGDLIKGVELNFDLESTENYTSGQKQNRTDLDVGISKKLLNDRLKVTVGSSFGLEGSQQANQQSNVIADDISADYALSKDGRYRLRAYRKNDYQVALQGQVIETGVSFIITMNYNKFKELFMKAKKDKAKLKKKEPISKT